MLKGPYGIIQLVSGADGSAHGQTLSLEANSFDPNALCTCLLGRHRSGELPRFETGRSVPPLRAEDQG